MSLIRLFLFLFLISVQSLHGQETRHFTRHFQTMVPESTENERKYAIENGVTHIEDRTNGELKCKATINGLSDIDQVNEFAFYGYAEAPGLLYKDYFINVNGEFLVFQDDDGLTRHYIIKNKKCYFVQVWDSEKKEVLVNGNGRSSYFLESDNEEVVAVFSDSIKVLSYGIRMMQKDTIYYTYDKMALPPGGLQVFYTELVKKVKYPLGAQLAGKEARIYIQFIVDENGKLRDFKSLANGKNRFEEKTLKKLEAFPNWEPATYRGRKVKTKYVLPVVFKLE